MPFALIVIGLLLIVSGARGTYPALKALLISDFTGDKNFLQWIVAFGAAGMLGYIPALEKFSRVFMTLLVVALFLAEKGFFEKFSQALKQVGQGGGVGAVPAGAPTGFAQQVIDLDTASGSSTIGSAVTSILGRR